MSPSTGNFDFSTDLGYFEKKKKKHCHFSAVFSPRGTGKIAKTDLFSGYYAVSGSGVLGNPVQVLPDWQQDALLYSADL